MFKIAIHDVPEAFFSGGATSKASKSAGGRRARKPRPSRGKQDELKGWQRRAEQMAKRYATLLHAYKQLKAKADASPDWRGRCQKLVNELLRIVSACDLTGAVDRTQQPDATLDAVLAGIRQLRDQTLEHLCDLGLLQPVEPEVGEKFDRVRCIAVGTTDDDALDNAIVNELVERGYAHNDQIVKHAKVKIAPASKLIPESP